MNRNYLEQAVQQHVEVAAKHFTEAHKNHQEGNYERAAYHAQIANEHDAKANDYSREAANIHSEQHGTKK